MQKIKNIEFLRFLMIIGIVMLHAYSNKHWALCKIYPDIELFQILKQTFSAANNGVEGFFIIAGFLFILTFKPLSSFFDFVKSKYIRLAPVIIITSIIGLIASMFHLVKIKLLPTILSMFLLNDVIYQVNKPFLPATWFASALMTAFIIFYLLKKYTTGKIYWITLSLLTSSGYLILHIFRDGYFTNPSINLFGFLSVGFLRSISGFGIGALLGEFYKKHKDKIFNFKPNVFLYSFLSILEIGLLSFIIHWLYIKHSFIYHIFFVLAFTLLLFLFVCQKGIISKFLNKDWCVFWGKYSYSIYVTHVALFKLITSKLWIKYPEFVHAYPLIPVIVDLALVILLGVFAYHLIEKPCATYLYNKFGKK